MSEPLTFGTRPTATVTFSFVDAAGQRSTLSLALPVDTPIADAHTAATAIAAELHRLSTAALEGYSITYSAVRTSAAPVIPAETRSARKGVLTFRSAQARTATYQIPAIQPTVVRANHGLDPDALAPLITLLTAGLWCDASGAPLISLATGYEALRRWSGRG